MSLYHFTTFYNTTTLQVCITATYFNTVSLHNTTTLPNASLQGCITTTVHMTTKHYSYSLYHSTLTTATPRYPIFYITLSLSTSYYQPLRHTTPLQHSTPILYIMVQINTLHIATPIPYINFKEWSTSLTTNNI